MIKKWRLIVSNLSDTPRRAYIYLPKDIKKHPDKRYPVLYMFDGHNVFFDKDATYGKSWGMKEYLDAHRTDLIVAAVECNHAPDGSRLSEYSPFDFSIKNAGDIKGKGRKTMQWLINEFKPYVDKNFPTLPDRNHTFIGGSSMGGLMALYALCEYNNVFSAGGALSPSLWVAPAAIEQLVRLSKIHPETRLYMDYGEKEISYRKSMLTKLHKISGILIKKGVKLTFRLVPHGTHSEASWQKQLPFFINTILY